MNPYNNLSISKIVLIVGGPGARKDFVGGWLGLCNGFIRTPWRIDPLVGYSKIDTGTIWTTPLILDQIESGSLRIDPSANRTLAITAHVDDNVSVSNSNIKKLAELVNSGILSIAGIDLDRADMIQYHWDRLFKVYLCLGMEYNQYYRQYNANLCKNLFETSGDILTDEHAVNFINRRINIALEEKDLPGRDQDIHWRFYKKLEPLAPVDLNYAELFKPGGSYYLCGMLGTTAPERAHIYWDTMLPFINSPDSCHAFGRDWDKSMIIK
jgi:hypothetical protein